MLQGHMYQLRGCVQCDDANNQTGYQETVLQSIYNNWEKYVLAR